MVKNPKIKKKIKKSFFVRKIETACTVRPWIFIINTVIHSYQNILSEKEQWTFLWRQEVLLSPKDKLSRWWQTTW